MNQEPPSPQRPKWLESSGLPHLVRIPRLAIRTDNLGLGLAALLATLALGTALDWVWSLRGGVGQNAVAQYRLNRQLDQTYVEPSGEFGIFQVWHRHQRSSLVELMTSCLPGKTYLSGTAVGRLVETHSGGRFLGSVADLGYGMCWLISAHPFYAVLFLAGALIIWALAGGAICRIIAVQFAHEELLTYRQGLDFAWRKLWQGFVMAPCMPLLLAFIVAVLMVLGGLLLRIPLLGDVVGGVAFFLAILGGFVLGGLLVGLLLSGHLYWPTIAAEGSDAFDAFSRGFAYVFTRPLKALWYGVVALVITAVCWFIANLGVFIALSLTRAVVGFGTAPFGWFKRQVGPDTTEAVRKLDLLWPVSEDALYRAPNWQHLGIFEYVSAGFIGFWVLLVVIALWSFLASLYFSSTTIVYFLLRRDVDGTDLEDVQFETEEDQDDFDSGRPAATPPPEPLGSGTVPPTKPL